MTDEKSRYVTLLYKNEKLHAPITIEVQGGIPTECKEALDQAIVHLEIALRNQFNDVCSGLTIRLGDDLVEGGGEAKAEENLIHLDRKKMAMSLQDAEDLLVGLGLFNPGERTKTLHKQKDKPWSCLTYELIHETGHIADWKLPGAKYNRVRAELSPTKYGKQNSWEAFAEIFTYWVLGTPIQDSAQKIMKSIFANTRDKL